jgi:hypothetical protein
LNLPCNAMQFVVFLVDDGWMLEALTDEWGMDAQTNFGVFIYKHFVSCCCYLLLPTYIKKYYKISCVILVGLLLSYLKYTCLSLLEQLQYLQFGPIFWGMLTRCYCEIFNLITRNFTRNFMDYFLI